MQIIMLSLDAATSIFSITTTPTVAVTTLTTLTTLILYATLDIMTLPDPYMLIDTTMVMHIDDTIFMFVTAAKL